MPGARRSDTMTKRKRAKVEDIKEGVTTAEIIEGQQRRYVRSSREVTYEQWVTFFTTLAQTAHVTRSAEAAGIDRKLVYERKGKDPEFNEVYEAALMKGRETLLEEAQRRAFDGYDKPVFQGGMRVGIIREYSDSLAAFLLKGYMPKLFKDRTENVNLNVDAGPALSDDEMRAVLFRKLTGKEPPLSGTSGEEQP